MKYFTPDLVARFGSSDVRVAEEASEQWDERQDTYMQYLNQIRGRLPKTLQRLLDEFSLHDARVLGGGFNNRTLVIMLALDTAKNTGVLLNYKLASKVRAAQYAPLADEQEPLEWLYDEMELITGRDFEVFRHSILFTGGRELRVTFYDLELYAFNSAMSPAGTFEPRQANGAHELLWSALDQQVGVILTDREP